MKWLRWLITTPSPVQKCHILLSLHYCLMSHHQQNHLKVTIIITSHVSLKQAKKSTLNMLHRATIEVLQTASYYQ